MYSTFRALTVVWLTGMLPATVDTPSTFSRPQCPAKINAMASSCPGSQSIQTAFKLADPRKRQVKKKQDGACKCENVCHGNVRATQGDADETGTHCDISAEIKDIRESTSNKTRLNEVHSVS
jgi:hypothetical protein